MEEIQQDLVERHPAETLNDSWAFEFMFWVPALALHTLITSILMLWLCDLAANLLMLPWPWLFNKWFRLAAWYALSLVMGLAWGPKLNRWLLNTSRFVWVLPALWCVYYYAIWIRQDFSTNIAQQRGTFGPALAWLLRMTGGGAWPFICSVGYAVGAWIRRDSGDEIPKWILARVGESAWPETRQQVWTKAVQVWRAGRSMDHSGEV